MDGDGGEKSCGLEVGEKEVGEGVVERAGGAVDL